MKRSITLVSYESSDEDAEPLPRCDNARLPRKKKLPRVASSLTIPTPKPDPALHQGRVRTIPHVDGQFAAFAYIPLIIEENSKLYKLLEETVHLAKIIEPALKCDWLDSGRRSLELHISLTRPIYLRHHQRDELKRAVKAAARSHNP
ncbi:hypothetical protein EW145_g4749 [Phellinidium pouzarii]|uniref:U6 snRNA phosphodiesterase 1 n=1 Tax=Phellinidium pouzarii TaxID=167371 RepID=A0A4S4L3S5_9AGAM|nr:hypothetical protein EW145_g4749 [Phellinidium pouzarii]